MSSAPIRIVAALVLNDAGHTLVVRKRGTEAFMQPGGKLEPGEPPLAALSREVAEELGCAIDPGSAVELGVYQAPAAHEPGRIVEARLYEVRLTGPASACAEIETLAWIDPAAPGDLPLAQLTRDHVLPLAAARAPR